MRFRDFLALLLLSSPVLSEAATWAEVQKSPTYLSAKRFMADFLPDLAIPEIEKLLADPKLDPKAHAPLLSLLGEAQVRAGLPEVALRTLDDGSLREFSPAHLWRSYALVNLGRYRDAIGELKKIDRRSMRTNADLQMGKLYLALGQTKEAREKLQPVADQSKDPALAKAALFQLVSLTITEQKPEDALSLLEKVIAATPLEESLVRYLQGRIDLAQGNRVEAVGTFQTLVADPEIKKTLPAALFHESTLALADSLALDENYGTAIDSVFQTLTAYPDSPRLTQFFARLKSWHAEAPGISLEPRLSAWIPESSAEIPQPLKPRALHTLQLLSGQNLSSEQEEDIQKGRQLAARLQLEAPLKHPLVSQSLLDLGLLEMRQKRYQQALTNFELIETSSASSTTKSFAKAMTATIKKAQEEPTLASQLFLEAEALAAKAQNTELRSLAALNAGISLLTSTRAKELDEITRNLDSPEARSFLILERGLFLSAQRDPGARDFLESFLANFPDNSRTSEAALALAESAVFTPPFDRELAEAQVDSLRFDLNEQPTFEARRILVLLALGKGTRKAYDFVNRAATHPLADRVLFQLGQTYRQPTQEEGRQLGKANLQFELLVEKYPDSEFVDAARFYSALTSVALNTESADKKAVKRFQELIEQKGPLAREAAINLCSLRIDRDQEDLALAQIEQFLTDKSLPASDRRRFLILAADAANQQGDYEKALGFYDQLLKSKNLSVAVASQAQFIRGQALEKLGRKQEALQAYYSVINQKLDPEKTTTLEWKWFDKNGIEGALALLEREGRSEAAIQLAERISQSGSPRADDALEIAERIGLENFIYRGRKAPTQKDAPAE